MSWLVDVVPLRERPRVESALACCSLLSLPRGGSLGAVRFEGVPLISIEDGIAIVSAGNRGSARRIVVGLAGPGAILLAPARDERLEALADTRLTLISASAHLRLLEIAPAASVIVDAVEDGLRDCRDSLAQFGSRHHADRVCEKLVQLARTHGKVGTKGLLLDLPLTHELLADMVGSTRETVTRSLARLAAQGLIRQEGGRYLVGGAERR